MLAVPAIALLACLSVFAACWGAADSLAYGATREINTWTASGRSPGIDAWLWVRDDLRRARELSPADPGIVELLGVLHLQRAGRAEFAEIALEHLEQALVLRPSSRYTWANVAEARYRLGRTGPPFAKVLEQAWRQGPSEPEVQRLLAELGLALWDELPAATRRDVAAAVAAGMRRNPLEILRISERRGRLRLACKHVAGDRRLAGTRWMETCRS